ncbi:MAG: hypothetical protein KKF48_03405, partial [Nanoarchaeota archaeon]|nr:hypothetical protein [Nanoarchaeota archaeon]MBU1028066.1 hypothetical protein [Nanoarchaeota archaeon]
YGARYYKSELGRFMQADVVRGGIADPLSLNRYVYVKNNPLKYIDPSGNFPQGAASPGDLVTYSSDRGYAYTTGGDPMKYWVGDKKDEKKDEKISIRNTGLTIVGAISIAYAIDILYPGEKMPIEDRKLLTEEHPGHTFALHSVYPLWFYNLIYSATGENALAGLIAGGAASLGAEIADANFKFMSDPLSPFNPDEFWVGIVATSIQYLIDSQGYGNDIQFRMQISQPPPGEMHEFSDMSLGIEFEARGIKWYPHAIFGKKKGDYEVPIYLGR